MQKLVWRVRLVADFWDEAAETEVEVARIERDEFTVPETLGVDWQFNIRLWTTGRILVTSCETLGPAVSIERVRQCVSFSWRNEIAIENASVDRPVDEFHFECSKCLRQVLIEMPDGHFSLSRAIEFQQQASPTLNCQSTHQAPFPVRADVGAHHDR